MPYFPVPEKQRLLEVMAAGRASAGMTNLGPDQGFAVRWRPKVSRHFVRNNSDPDQGFVLRADAVAAAVRYRNSCRAALKRGAV